MRSEAIGLGREFKSDSFAAYTELHDLTVPKSGELPYFPE